MTQETDKVGEGNEVSIQSFWNRYYDSETDILSIMKKVSIQSFWNRYYDYSLLKNTSGIKFQSNHFGIGTMTTIAIR